VFVNKKEVKKFFIGLRYQYKPWCSHGKIQQQTFAQMQSLPDPPVARHEGVNEQHGTRQDDGHWSFGHGCQCHSQPAQQHAIALFAWRGLIALREQQAAQGQCHHS